MHEKGVALSRDGSEGPPLARGDQDCPEREGDDNGADERGEIGVDVLDTDLGEVASPLAAPGGGDHQGGPADDPGTPATGVIGPLFKAARIALPPNVRDSSAACPSRKGRICSGAVVNVVGIRGWRHLRLVRKPKPALEHRRRSRHDERYHIACCGSVGDDGFRGRGLVRSAGRCGTREGPHGLGASRPTLSSAGFLRAISSARRPRPLGPGCPPRHSRPICRRSSPLADSA